MRLMWFRCDLRLDDNPALQAACQAALQAATPLLPIFIFDPRHFNVPTLAGARKCGPRRARFLLESVAALRSALEQRGSGLAVALGKTEEVMPRVCRNVEEIYLQETVCSEERSLETALEKALEGNVKLRRVWGGSLFLPEEWGQDSEKPSASPSAFKNKAEEHGHIREPLGLPTAFPELPREAFREELSFMPSLQALGFSDEDAEAASKWDPRAALAFEGGEKAAMARMQKWMFDDDRLKEYFEIRNGMLGEGYSSKFSPWLALGCISPRRIWKEVQRYEAERVKNKSTYWLIFELEVRDFWIYLAKTYGNLIFKPGGIVGNDSPWDDYPDRLENWKNGSTGDLLVDANMRELKTTGFMSNRGRQNVASYLIFDLEVDWRYGAAHFEEYLLDYDPCANWGNWVAAAGLTGQRINRFNTKKQLNDYDPDRAYVRHWLGSDIVDDPKRNCDEAGSGKGSGKGKGKVRHKGSKQQVMEAGRANLQRQREQR